MGTAFLTDLRARSTAEDQEKTSARLPAGYPAKLPDLFRLAEVLLGDDDVMVSKPVGLALKYAGLLDEPAPLSFLDTHAAHLRRPALRYATEKPALRKKYA